MGNPTYQQWNYFHSIQGRQKFPGIFKEVSGYWAAENAEIRVWHNPRELRDPGPPLLKQKLTCRWWKSKLAKAEGGGAQGKAPGGKHH